MIERKVTLAVVLALVVESAAVFLWAGGAGARIKELETRVASQGAMGERMARLEVRLEQAAAQLDRIEKKVERKG